MRIARVLMVAGLGFLAVALAQGATYDPPCSEVLKYAPEAFSDRYTQKNDNASEVGFDDAAIVWAGCKYDANLARLGKYPQLKARLVQLHKLEDQFFRTESNLAFSASGGGTMYSHGFARFQVNLQLQLEKLINLTTTAAGAAQSASISAKYKAAQTKLEARIKRVQTPNPYVDGYTKTEAGNRRKAWLEDAKQYAATYQSIKRLIGSRVDATGLEVMQFLADGIWPEDL